MRLEGKVVVVTGAANGIGAALARRFASEGARALVLADVDEANLAAVASDVGGLAVRCDVTDPASIESLVHSAERDAGPIDLFCSNAGVVVPGGVESPDDVWRRCIDVNVMAHVWAARAVVPRMAARGGGYLLNTASAAGLLTQLGSATYSVTKHAAVALDDVLALTPRGQGVQGSGRCPPARRPAVIGGTTEGGVAGVDGVIEPSDVAQAVIEGLDEERFLILPHPQVLEYYRRKGSDYDRWLGGMRRLQSRFLGGT